MKPAVTLRLLTWLSIVWTLGALGAWIAALSGAPLMVTLGDHVAGMVYGAFGTAVLALLHVPALGLPAPRWRLPVVLIGQGTLLLGGAAASVVSGLRAPVLITAAVGWAAVAISMMLARSGIGAAIAASAVAGLAALADGRLDLGVALGVHAFLVPAVVVLAVRLEGGELPHIAERAVVLLGLAHALFPAARLPVDLGLLLLVVAGVLDRGPWGPGPRSGALRIGFLWLAIGYGGEGLALLLGERVGSLPTHALLVGGVASLLIDSTVEAGGGAWSKQSALGLFLVQVAVIFRVVPLALGSASALALVVASVSLGIGLAVGMRRT